MTQRPPPDARPLPSPPVPTAGSWLALFWERFWQAFWVFFTLLLAVLALALSPVTGFLPGWLHGALVGVAALALLGGFGWGLRRFRGPTKAEVFHRLDQDSGPHRFLSATRDTLTVGGDDPLTQALWDRHQRTAHDALKTLRPRWPSTGVWTQDRYRLRYVAPGLLVLSLWANGGAVKAPLIAFLSPSVFGPAEPVTVRLWLTPPDYTGQPPQTFDTSTTEGVSGTPVTVPQGTTVLALVQGPARKSVLTGGTKDIPFEDLDARSKRVETDLRDSGTLTIRAGRTVLFQRPLDIVPDQPPMVQIDTAPTTSPRGRLSVSVQATDDYGLASVGLTLEPKAELDPQDVPLQVTLLEPRDASKILKTQGTLDLTDHAWAGHLVRITPWAVDTLGQRSQGKEVEITLPVRTFTHPVAQEIARLRSLLGEGPDRIPDVIDGLDAVTDHPDAWQDDLTVFLVLRAVRAHLALGGGLSGPADRDEIGKTLWATALRVEDGKTAALNQDLDALRDRLNTALSGDLSQAEMDRLMGDIQETLARMSQDMMRRMAEMGPDNALLDAMARLGAMEQDADLADLLQEIQELNRLGAKDAARQALERLANSLNALEAANITPEQMELLGQVTALAQDLEIVREDQATLLDDTFQGHQACTGKAARPGDIPSRSQGETITRPGDRLVIPDFPPNDAPLDLRPAPPPDGRAEKQAPLCKTPNGETRDLAQRQDDLARRLEKILAGIAEDMGDLLPEIPPNLNEAAVAMTLAHEALEKGTLPTAMTEQRTALEKLSQGQKDAMGQMKQALGMSFGVRLRVGGGGGQGRPGTDPLGRPQDGTGNGADTLALPDQEDRMRARAILDELRRRANDPGRSPLEKDYIDRLIPRF